MDEGRKRIHTERLWSFSDEGITDAVERGRAWIQRNYREWPYGHKVFYRIETRKGEDWVNFFFVPSDDPPML